MVGCKRSLPDYSLVTLSVFTNSLITYQDLATEEVLFYHNDPSTAIFAVESGRIKLVHYTEAGKTVNHYSISVGECFAEVVLFDDVYVCTAIAELPSRIILFPNGDRFLIFVYFWFLMLCLIFTTLLNQFSN
ncbi:cyclic nucleotide-binding protein [Fischerella thermalis BR2B]|uniref:cyclic nucleotide-binding domain-containing protein n=1 Tax=Fischerella thermalis TaxID=372787 RepID=UPI000C7FFFC7|nr:cyclic nucleotide-binding domain-containing protein [Fischerella thermalis]PMB37007.1 cyclic nucleotide-binding protein [Fischerella thermalis BR2B]